MKKSEIFDIPFKVYTEKKISGGFIRPNENVHFENEVEIDGDLVVKRLSSNFGITVNGNSHLVQMSGDNMPKFKIGDKVKGYNPYCLSGEVVGKIVWGPHTEPIGKFRVWGVEVEGGSVLILDEYDLEHYIKEKPMTLYSSHISSKDWGYMALQDEIAKTLTDSQKKGGVMEMLRSIPDRLKRMLREEWRACYRLGWLNEDLSLTIYGSEELINYLFDKEMGQKVPETFGDYAVKTLKEREKEEKK
jgi:hypothetical protein